RSRAPSARCERAEGMADQPNAQRRTPDTPRGGVRADGGGQGAARGADQGADARERAGPSITPTVAPRRGRTRGGWAGGELGAVTEDGLDGDHASHTSRSRPRPAAAVARKVWCSPGLWLHLGRAGVPSGRCVGVQSATILPHARGGEVVVPLP